MSDHLHCNQTELKTVWLTGLKSERYLIPSVWASLNSQCLLEVSPVSDLEDFMVAQDKY